MCYYFVELIAERRRRREARRRLCLARVLFLFWYGVVVGRMWLAGWSVGRARLRRSRGLPTGTRGLNHRPERAGERIGGGGRGEGQG